MELSPELRDLLRDNMFAPLRKALAEENILTVESFRTVRPWAFLNEHDLYPMADRQSISLRILKLRDDAVKTPAEEDLNDVPYAKRFSREPALYDAYPITDCGFSVRVLGRLQARGINSVGKLLEQTDSKLLAISGFGRNSINEVHDYLSKLEERSLSKVKTDIKVDATDEVLKYKDRIWAGDFSFVEADNLSTRSRLAVHTLENAYHVLGSDLVTAVREKPDYIKHLKKMLEGFITDVQIVSACEGIIQKIPTSRRDIDAKTVIKAYTANTETQSSLLVNYSEGASLRQFIFSNGEAIANQDAKLMRFLKWCEYDVKTELTEQLRLTIKTDQMRTVLYGRARGATLAELGDQLGVTRERIRQIEAKIYRHLKDWFKRHRINQKIFLDLEESIALPADRIAEYVREIGTEVVYLLKEYAEEDYSYLPQNDLFLLGEKECFTKVQEEINQLPEIVTADSMDQLISQTAESTGYPEKLIRIIENYSLHELDLQGAEQGRLASSDTARAGAESSFSAERDAMYRHANKGMLYVVAFPGDTPWDIAQRFDVPLKKILDYNELRYDSQLIPGQYLFLVKKKTSGAEPFYTVAQGDTMYSIAQKLGMTVESLYAKNRIKAGVQPPVGTKLYLKRTIPRRLAVNDYNI